MTEKALEATPKVVLEMHHMDLYKIIFRLKTIQDENKKIIKKLSKKLEENSSEALFLEQFIFGFITNDDKEELAEWLDDMVEAYGDFN